VGWDSHEIIASELAKFSCLKHSSVKVEFHPLQQHVLRAKGIYKKPLDKKQNTEFTYLRFLVPFLNNYEGWALFTDDDMFWRADIGDLIDLIDDKYAVMCVKHSPDVKCLADTKLAGVPQEMYPRKNWSSVMLINCAHPATKKLTPELVATASPAYLHRMYWAVNEGAEQDDETLIGELPSQWNWLVDWYPRNTAAAAKLVHFTDGGPWYPDYRTRVNDDGSVGVDHQDEWLEQLKEYEKTLDKPRLLGPYELFSTHTPRSKSLPGYANSNDTWSWDDDEKWQEHVKNTLLKDQLDAIANAAK